MLKGVVSVPGDKSITHRALLLAALASGTSEIIRPLQSRDCGEHGQLSACFRYRD